METQNEKYKTVARELGLVICDILPIEDDRFTLVWGRVSSEMGLEVHHVWFRRRPNGAIRLEWHVRQRVQGARLAENNEHGIIDCGGRCDLEMETSLVILAYLSRTDALPNMSVPYFGNTGVDRAKGRDRVKGRQNQSI